MQQRERLKYAMKISSRKKSKDIDRKLLKEGFIAHVIVAPLFFIILFNIVAFIIDGRFYWMPFIAFPIMFFMWTIVSISISIEEKSIEKELRWK